MKEEDLIPISKMAAMHGISRQTLILYDKNGLFKPAYTNETGYRFYSAEQIPYLREICFLKNIGILLSDIHKYQQNPSINSMLDMLNSREKILNHDIKQLEQEREFLTQRKSLLAHISTQSKNLNQPFVEWIPERKAVYSPFVSENMDKCKLHLTLMKAWDKIADHGMLPSKGFGATVKIESINAGTPLKDAGSIIILPIPENFSDVDLITIPAGEYVTMYKYGMPYDMKPTMWLLDWMNKNNYKPSGDIVDLCLLDTTFYDESHQTDFCRLEIPIS